MVRRKPRWWWWNMPDLQLPCCLLHWLAISQQGKLQMSITWLWDAAIILSGSWLPNSNHMTAGVPGWPELQGPIIKYHSFSTIANLNGHWTSVKRGLLVCFTSQMANILRVWCSFDSVMSFDFIFIYSYETTVVTGMKTQLIAKVNLITFNQWVSWEMTYLCSKHVPLS